MISNQHTLQLRVSARVLPKKPDDDIKPIHNSEIPVFSHCCSLISFLRNLPGNSCDGHPILVLRFWCVWGAWQVHILKQDNYTHLSAYWNLFPFFLVDSVGNCGLKFKFHWDTSPLVRKQEGACSATCGTGGRLERRRECLGCRQVGCGWLRLAGCPGTSRPNTLWLHGPGICIWQQIYLPTWTAHVYGMLINIQYME